MPGMFITPDDRVPIAETGEIDPMDISPDRDVIWIYPVMPVGVEQRVIGRAVAMRQRQQERTPRGRRGRAPMEMSADPGIYNIALLEANILAWQGPSFTNRQGRPIPCTPEYIRQLNTRQPLLQRVLQEIGERNADAEGEGAEVVAGDEGEDAVDLNGSVPPNGLLGPA